MQSSKERILAARREHRYRLFRWLLIVAFAVAALVLLAWCVPSPASRGKWISSLGLLLDVIGASMVALPLFRPYKDPVKDGTQFLSYYEPHRTAAVVQHQERLTLPMQVGASIFVAGFVLQLVGLWVPSS